MHEEKQGTVVEEQSGAGVDSGSVKDSIWEKEVSECLTVVVSIAFLISEP